MPNVLVTGGAKRLGEVMCRELANDMHVVVHANASMQDAERLAAEIGGSAVQCDLQDEVAVESLIEAAATAAGGPIDYLVNNASQFPIQSWREATVNDVAAMMRLHAWAPATLIRQLAAQGGKAAVNMLDTRISSLDLHHGPYMLSKQALANLTKTLAAEYAPLRVNAVAPGPILPGTDGSDMDPAVQATVLKRAGTPEEVAKAVRFMLEATYTTGDTIFVDGGRHLV